MKKPYSRLLWRAVTASVLLLSAFTFPGASIRRSLAAPANVAVTDGFRISVSKVQPLPTKKGKAVYSVGFEYVFQNRRQIRIEGLGWVPPNGAFNFLTYEQALRFYDADGGFSITVPLQRTHPPEGGALDLPTEAMFKPDFLAGVYKGESAFVTHLESILNRQFVGYLPRQQKGRTYTMTTFRVLGGVPDNIRSEIALLISFPHDRSKDHTRFHVQSLVRWRRKKSDPNKWQAASNQAVGKAAHDFVLRTIDELAPRR